MGHPRALPGRVETRASRKLKAVPPARGARYSLPPSSSSDWWECLSGASPFSAKEQTLGFTRRAKSALAVRTPSESVPAIRIDGRSGKSEEGFLVARLLGMTGAETGCRPPGRETGDKFRAALHRPERFLRVTGWCSALEPYATEGVAAASFDWAEFFPGAEQCRRRPVS
jgi:hypothetical protein